MLGKYFTALRRVGTLFIFSLLIFIKFRWLLLVNVAFYGLLGTALEMLGEKTTYKESKGLAIFGTALLTWILGISLALVL
jgi:hypothetical protein